MAKLYFQQALIQLSCHVIFQKQFEYAEKYFLKLH